MKTIQAIYENGVFKPLERVDLPERCEVEFEPRVINPQTEAEHLDKVYAILSRSFETGDPNMAARHDEHQP